MRPSYLNHSAWTEHVPFAFWLIETLRPRIFVELGTHWGTSYFSFCQAIDKLSIGARAFAVDSWEGDEHSGKYGGEVYQHVKKYNGANYGSFSSLLKLRFDEANDYFIDGSIDLLHIDGFHEYEAVKSDFDRWLPKLSDKGVVLLHDTNVRERNFGVFKLLEELRETYNVFEFFHGHGLGVVAVGNSLSPRLRSFFECENDEKSKLNLQLLFSGLGRSCLDAYQNRELSLKQESFKELETEAAARKESLGSANDKIKALTENLQKSAEKAEEVSALRIRLDESLASARRAEEACSEANVELALAQQRITHADQEAEWHRAELSRCEEDLRKLKSELEVSHAIASNQASKGKALQTENEEMKSDLQEVKRLLFNSERDNTAYADQILELRRSLDNSAEEKAVTDKVISALRDHVNLLMDGAEAAKATITWQEERYQRQSEEIKILMSERSSAFADLEEARTASTNAQNDRELEKERYLGLQCEKREVEMRLKYQFDEILAFSRILSEKERQLSIVSEFRIIAGKELGRAILSAVRLSSIWSIAPKKYRMHRQIRLLKGLGIFDPIWYQNYYIDVQRAGVEPYRHYIEHGAHEGRHPNDFCSKLTPSSETLPE